MSQPSPLSSPVLQPVAATERIAALDILRGAALLGILLMNIEGYAGPLTLSLTGIDPHWSGVDRVVDALVFVLVQGKFFTLFSLLFGAGFAVMSLRAEQARREFAPFFLRRTTGLLLIGLLHGVLLWQGDILVSYALVSLLLLAFATLPRSWLPAFGVGIYLMGGALMILLAVMMTAVLGDGLSEAVETARAQALETVAHEREVLAHGTWLQGCVLRLKELPGALWGLLVTGPEILGMFLLGGWFVRSGALTTPERFSQLYGLLRWGAWPAGLILALISAYWQPWQPPGGFSIALSSAWTLNSIAGLLMSMGYLAWFMHWRAHLDWLAPAGRMALTNYVGQSLLCTMLFYGFGFGWFEQLPRAWQVPFALVLFALQVLVSRWWLSRWRFGPLEWLWRSLTYRRWQPMRLVAVQPDR